jgi:hypothetical protein
MRELTAVAERLRTVKQAHQRFLTLWAAQHLAAKPSSLDRVAADMLRHPTSHARDVLQRMSRPTDDSDRWSQLYRGSVLDD